MRADQIVVLKNAKEGIKVDTVYNGSDTLYIDFTGMTIIEVPEKRIDVNTYPSRDGWEVAGILAAIIGGLAAVIGAFVAFRQLFNKSRNIQAQIDKLADVAEALKAQNKLIEEGNQNLSEYAIQLSKSINLKEGENKELVAIEQKRLKLMVKPNLRTGGRHTAGGTNFGFHIVNEGQRCKIDSIEMIEGEDQVSISGLKQRPELKSGGQMSFEGRVAGTLNVNEIAFKLRIEYHDEGDFRHESVVGWKGHGIKLETKEL